LAEDTQTDWLVRCACPSLAERLAFLTATWSCTASASVYIQCRRCPGAAFLRTMLAWNAVTAFSIFAAIILCLLARCSACLFVRTRSASAAYYYWVIETLRTLLLIIYTAFASCYKRLNLLPSLSVFRQLIPDCCLLRSASEISLQFVSLPSLVTRSDSDAVQTILLLHECFHVRKPSTWLCSWSWCWTCSDIPLVLKLSTRIARSILTIQTRRWIFLEIWSCNRVRWRSVRKLYIHTTECSVLLQTFTYKCDYL
jgi:hypothetical protein